MGKSKKNYKNRKGGKVIASGGYGCVFDPPLKCEGSTKRDSNKISKLMNNAHATTEFEEINSIKKQLDSIPNYEDYFLVNDATICRPAKLTATDLTAYGDKCNALPKDDITKANINSKLDEVMALNIPNGGLPVDDYIYTEGTYQKIYDVHIKLVKLLKDGILPMNNLNIYHSDIKDSNVLIDDFTSSDLKARLIDWGLTVDYKPDSHETFPKSWRNRPLQFNVPFSVVIFTDSFYEKYSKYLKEGGKTDKKSLYSFVLNYLNEWMKKRGAGHYKFINEIMFKLYNDTLDSISKDDRPNVVETEITIPTIVEYICDVLAHYTKYNQDGSLNLREYLDEVFIKIVDVWGFVNVYYPMLEMLSNNYLKLKENEMKIFKQIQFIFNEYLYSPRHEPINMTDLYSDLKVLGNLIHIVIHGKRKTSASASGIRTKKNRKVNMATSPVFKRKPLIKRFKNPFFLSLK
jgi:serine/threonine protein kinase